MYNVGGYYRTYFKIIVFHVNLNVTKNEYWKLRFVVKVILFVVIISV